MPTFHTVGMFNLRERLKTVLALLNASNHINQFGQTSASKIWFDTLVPWQHRAGQAAKLHAHPAQ